MRSFLIGSVVVVAMAGMAGAQVRLAELGGSVRDESGGALPGATVTARHLGTGQVRTTVTEPSGAYLLGALEVGEYEVRVDLSGFSPVIYKVYRLAIGESARLDVTLKVATVQETITVMAEAPLVDTSTSSLSGRVSQTQIDELPLTGRNWLNLARLAPGVKSADGGGQPTAGVGDSRMSKVVLDGGSVQNLSTVAIDLEISKEIIDQFEVLTNRFDAVMGRAGTVVVNAVTKGGSDRVGGSVFGYWRDDSLNAKDFFTGRVEPYENQQYGFTVGGPLWRGRTHAFGSYERQVEPKTLSSNTGFAQLDQPVPADDRRNLYFVRFDHSVTNNHRATVRFNRFDQLRPANGVGGTETISGSTTWDFATDRYNFGLNSVFGSRFVNQVQVTWLRSWRNFDRFTGPPLRTELGFASPVNRRYSFPSLTIGGATNVGNERPRFWQVRSDATYFVEKWGQHKLKFGVEYADQYISGIFAANANGTFFFNSDPANLGSCCLGGDQTKWDISRFPIPARYTQAVGDFFYDAPNNIFGVYAQDDWTPTPRLTVNLGLRYDVETGSLDADTTGLVARPRENDTNNVQPRAGFAWDVRGNGRTVVRGGGGLYYDQVWLNLTFNQRRTNSGALVTVTTFNTGNDPNFINNGLGGLTFEQLKGLAGAANVTIFAEGAEQPHVWTGSVGLAQQFGTDYAVSADYVLQRSDTMLKSVDTNLFCCRADGLPLPIRAGTFPELGGAVAGAGRPNAQFNTITTYQFVGRSRYHGLQMAFNKRMSRNYQFGVTYLLSSNKDMGIGTGANNPFDLEDEYGRSTLDERHRLVANWVSRLPFGFTFGGIFFAASGRPIVTTTGGVDINGDGTATADRPVCGIDPRFDPGCGFLGIARGTRVPRNALSSEPVYRIDLRVSRPVRINRVMIDPVVEISNLLNRRNYDPSRYNNSLASARFGQPGRSDALPYSPRQAQVGVRMTF